MKAGLDKKIIEFNKLGKIDLLVYNDNTEKYSCVISEPEDRMGLCIENGEVLQFRNIVKLGEYVMNEYLLKNYDEEFGKLLAEYLIVKNKLGMAEYFLDKSKMQMLTNKTQSLLDLEQALFYALCAQLEKNSIYFNHIPSVQSLYMHAMVNGLNEGENLIEVSNIGTSQSIENIQKLFDYTESVLDTLSPKVVKDDILQ